MRIVVVDSVDDVVGVHEIINLVRGLFVGRLVSSTSGIFGVVDYLGSVLAVVVGFFVDAIECGGDDGVLDDFVFGIA